MNENNLQIFSFRFVSSLESRHLLYLQLRRSVLESQILCTDDELIVLGGFAIQSEIGDFEQSVSRFIRQAINV